MKSNCFIFARGGSKQLPRKNIRLLLGKPLIQYSIELGLKIPGINKLFVSTDDEEIANISKNLGATIINRPQELATDDAPEFDAWKHAIDWVVEKYEDFDEFISLPPTSPLRNLKDVENAMASRKTNDVDICIATALSNRNPYFNMVKVLNDRSVELVNKIDKPVFRRQDAPKVYDITTVVYVARKNFILKNNNIFDGTITSIEVPKSRSIDIDDINDFRLAELILKDEQNNASK